MFSNAVCWLLLIAETKRDFTGSDLTNFVINSNTQTSKEHDHDLLARMMRRLGACTARLGVPTALKLSLRSLLCVLSLRVAKAPETFVEDVTGVINKRSAGRFFARRTLGDRVPFGVLLVVAIIALGIIAYLMKSSPTGSLKVDQKHDSTTEPTKPIPTP